MRLRVPVPAILVVVALMGITPGASCTNPPTEHLEARRAAIIDQLGTLHPDERFIGEVTQELEGKGFAVTIIKSNEITVDMYRELPNRGFRLIIFRVHSTVMPGKEPLTGRIFLFTSEPYSQTRHVPDQLADRIAKANVEENDPYYFAVSADYIAASSQGNFDKSVIVMMGCQSLCSTDLAESFISRGALIYTGWTASVKLDFVDDFTIALVKNLCSGNTTIEQALYKTAGEKGVDPTYGAIFSYYPSENGCYFLWN